MTQHEPWNSQLAVSAEAKKRWNLRAKKPSQASQIMTPQASSCDQTCARPFHKSERSDHATMELLLGGPAARPRNWCLRHTHSYWPPWRGRPGGSKIKRESKQKKNGKVVKHAWLQNFGGHVKVWTNKCSQDWCWRFNAGFLENHSNNSYNRI